MHRRWFTLGPSISSVVRLLGMEAMSCALVASAVSCPHETVTQFMYVILLPSQL